jgi:GT2 family glycosyltransferase
MPEDPATTRFPPVTSVVLNWRGLTDTIACVRSLERSSIPTSIVIVDNASGDGSFEALSETFPRHLVLRAHANLGFGGGCNIGIRAALERGADYVVLVNNDARVFGDTVERLVSLAEAAPTIGLVGGVLLNEGSATDVQMWGGGWLSLWSGRGRPFRKPVEWRRIDYLTGACLLIRRRVLEEIGLFDEQRFFMYCEDADLALRARRSGWLLAVADGARASHRGGASFRGDEGLAAQYAAHSLVAFLLKHARLPIVPIAFSTAAHLSRSLAERRFDRAAAIVRGRLSAFRAYARLGSSSPRRSSRPLSYSS